MKLHVYEGSRCSSVNIVARLLAGRPAFDSRQWQGFFFHHHTYRVSGDSMLMLQDLIHQIIHSQKCYVNMGPLLNGYADMGT
jgi:hypothetical protein